MRLIGDLVPGYLLQRMCLKAGYNGFCNRISDDGLLERLHVVAYPKRKLDGGTAEESLRSAAHGVALCLL